MATKKEKKGDRFREFLDLLLKADNGDRCRRMWEQTTAALFPFANFRMECWQTPRGLLLFQVWKGGDGFHVYADFGGTKPPNVLTDLVQWCLTPLPESDPLTEPLADLSWCAEDILTHRPEAGLTVDEARDLIDGEEDEICCRMMEAGWAAIDDALNALDDDEDDRDTGPSEKERL